MIIRKWGLKWGLVASCFDPTHTISQSGTLAVWS